MRDDFYPVVYNKDHHAVMKNDLVRGKQSMTTKEAKLLRLLITQVVKEDNDLKTYQIRITDLASFLDIGIDNLYRDIPIICKKLMRQVVEIKTGTSPKDRWTMFQWINRADYDGNGTVTFRLSDEIKPYIIELSEFYTQYKLKEVLSLSSFYAIRLYELLKCEYGVCKEKKNVFEFDIQYLREYFECEKKYKTTAIFILRTITMAVNEINQKTNLSIETENIIKRSRGKPIIGIKFSTMWFEDIDEKIHFNNRKNDLIQKYQRLLEDNSAN